MMKRKVLLILWLALLACLLVFGTACAADDPIVCSMELSPTKLAGPGTVNVTITISNSGNTDLQDPVVLYDPAAQIVSDFGTNGAALLKAGETMTWTGTYDVSQRTLEQGTVVYFVKYTLYSDSGEKHEESQPIRQKISLQTAEADIDVKRTISPTVAREDQEVVVNYEISNSGTVTLTDITIQENSDIHKEKQTIETLEAGKVARITYSVKMGKKNLTSGATITYKSETDSKAQTYTVEDTTITYGESALQATLTSSAKGVAVNDKLTLTLELKNSGSVDYSDIRVTDPSLGDVFTNQQLQAGQSLTLEKEITLAATTDYQFTVTAIDSTGTETVTATSAVTVTAVNPEDVLNLTIIATPDRTEVYEEPGLVRFSVLITNDSSVEAKNVVVSHGDTQIYTFESIPAGESRTMTRDTALSMAGKYRFTVTAEDPIENSLTFQSNEVQIAFSVPTPAPATATPPPVPTEEPTFSPVTMPPISDSSIGTVPKTIQMIFLPILIIGGLLLITCGVLLIIATKRRVEQRKASEAALDHLERSKRRDYVTPAEPDEEELKPETTVRTVDEDDDRVMRTQEMMDADEFELPHMKYARSAAQPQDDEDPLAPLSDALYDEEMTSDLSAYQTPVDDSVMYEQPYDENAVYDEGAYEDDGYTDGLEESYDETLPAQEVYDGTYTEPYDDGTVADPAAYDTTYGSYDDAGYDPAFGDSAYDATYDEGAEPYDYADPNDGHIPDDRENGGGDGGYAAGYDDSAFKRPVENVQPPRAAGRRTRKAGQDGDVGM